MVKCVHFSSDHNQQEKKARELYGEQCQKGKQELLLHINCAGGSHLFILRTKKEKNYFKSCWILASGYTRAAIFGITPC